jgi:prevent-host-death family protein
MTLRLLLELTIERAAPTFLAERRTRAMAGNWQAAEARHRFSDVVDAAVGGEPQFIRRRDGREVVVVSREYFERTKPNLASYLLSSGYADEQDDAFDIAMRAVRTEGGPLFEPREADAED